MKKNFMIKEIRRLLHSSIIRILIGGLLLVIIPVITICLIYSFSSIDMLRAEYDTSYANNTSLISEQFSDKLRDLEMTAAPLLVDEDLIMNELNPDLWDYNVFRNKLSLNFASRFIEANASVILPAQKRIISTKYGVDFFDKYESLTDRPKMDKGESMWAVRPTLKNKNENCLSLFTGYVSEKQTRPIIAVEISEAEIIGQLEALFGDNDKVLSAFLIDVNGEVFKLDKSRILNDNLLQTIIKSSKLGDDSHPFTYKDQDGLYRIIFNELENYQCLVGIIYDEQQIIAPVAKMIPILIGFLVFAIILAICYIIISYKKIYAPANALIDAMKCVADGNLQVRANIPDKSEFGMMSIQFNSMVEKLDISVKEKYLAQANLNKAQLKFLKSQIKPHFLYNCLFSLYNMIKSGDLDNAADMSIYLGRFYQMSSHFDDKDTTVSQEMENIKLYLKIQQLRSPDKFSYSCIIDEGLSDMIIPVISLHTIVENSISHAFEVADKENAIVIKAIYSDENDENIELIVADNGIGLSQNQCSELLEQNDNQDLSKETHGIQNVFMRFRLMYGQDVLFNISSKENNGTKFTITIPKKIAIYEKEEEKGENPDV